MECLTNSPTVKSSTLFGKPLDSILLSLKNQNNNIIEEVLKTKIITEKDLILSSHKTSNNDQKKSIVVKTSALIDSAKNFIIKKLTPDKSPEHSVRKINFKTTRSEIFSYSLRCHIFVFVTEFLRQ